MRRISHVTISLSALVLLAAACSGSDTTNTGTSGAVQGTTTVGPAGASPPESTTTSTTAAPAVAAPTTIAAPTTSTTALAATTPVASYRVVDVADDDLLNVRSGAGVANGIIAALSPFATNVLTTGAAAMTDDGGEWWEVDVATGVTGWVNSRYLTLIDQTSAGFADLPCAAHLSEGAHGPSTFAAPDTGTSDADHVLRVENVSGGGCDRTVVVLGSEFDFTPDRPEASIVPNDAVAFALGDAPASVKLDFPTLFHAAPDAIGGGTRKVVRSTEGPMDDIGLHGLYVDILTGPGAAAVTYLNDPARIVIDHRPVPAGSGYPQRAGGSGVELVIPARAPGAIVTADGGMFFGYARGFEGSLFVQLFDEFGVEPVVADFETFAGFGPPTTASFLPITVTDWLDAWGEFGFTVSGLAPGQYTMALSTENAADSATHTTLSIRFAVP